MSRPDPSPWPPARACVGRSSSAGKARPVPPRLRQKASEADERRFSPVPDGQDAHLPALQGSHSRKPEHLPGLLHHLRFDSEAAKRQLAATSALKVEGIIRHPPVEEAWEYYVTISIRNDRGEEVDRQVVNVGALQGAEKRTF